MHLHHLRDLIALCLLGGTGLLFRPIRTFIWSLSRGHQAVLALFVVFLIAGQVAGQNRRYFPFASWSMYSSPKSSIEQAVEVWGVDERSGDTVRVNVPKLYPPLARGTHRMSNYLRRVVGQAARGDTVATAHLSALLRAVGERYNRKHQREVIRRLGADLVVLDFDPSAENPWTPTRRRQQVSEVAL